MKQKNSIYVTQPFLPPLKEFTPYLEDIWERKWLTNNGYYHQELEKALCDYLGVKYLSLFSNGTLALITALQALRISGEVITTPFSFVATTHALWWNGINPVFVDIEPDFYNLDPKKIESAITPKTTAILAVHVYGNPCYVEEIQSIADKYGLKVIYDACHTFGVKLEGSGLANFGDLSVLSFHATKVFNTFEGGAIICHDEKMKKRIDFLKNFGFADEVTVVAPGINAKMNEIQAAFGLLQLKYIKQILDSRSRVAGLYNSRLQTIEGINLPQFRTDVEYNYSYYPILVDRQKYGHSRDDLYEYLKSEGIFTRRYFYPLISSFSTYQSLPSANLSNIPVASKVSEMVLCLPIYPDLSDSDVDQIISAIEKFHEK